MVRRIWIVALIVLSLASFAHDAQAAYRWRRGAIVDYLFGGYCRGPFGYGDFPYAGHCPMHDYAECGCPIR
jgi:hypothetical protein